jgi:hypothetical protein
LGAIERLWAMLDNRAVSFESMAKSVHEQLRLAYLNPVDFPAQLTGIDTLVSQACSQGAAAYRGLHQKRRLNKNGDAHKNILINGKTWHELRVLTDVTLLPAGAFDDLVRKAESLKTFKDYSDEALLQSPTTTASHDPFDPRNESDTAAQAELKQLEVSTETLHQTWVEKLLLELDDPSHQASLKALKPDEFGVVSAFRNERALPAKTADMQLLVAVLNTLLGGLVKREIVSAELVLAILDPTSPLTVAEVRKRFDGWLMNVIADNDFEHVRLALASDNKTTGDSATATTPNA